MSEEREQWLPSDHETKLVADAVWSLFVAGLLRKTPDIARQACDAAGITTEALRQAMIRHDRGYSQRPQLRLVPPPNVGTQTGNATEAKVAKKNPTPTTRRCSRCERILPRSKFPVKNKRTGTLKSMCAECMHEYQRDRYLSVEHGKMYRHILEFIVRQGDSCVGEYCPHCDRQIAIGDVVRGEASLAHVNCSGPAR